MYKGKCLCSLEPKQGRASKKAKVLWSPGTGLAGRKFGCLYLKCVKVDPFLSCLQMLPREAFIICAFGLALKGNCSRTAYGKRSANAIECELAKFCPHLHPCSLIAFSEVALISPMAEFVWDVIERRWECIMWLWQWASLGQLFQWFISWLWSYHLTFLCSDLLSNAYLCWPVLQGEITVEFLGHCREG